MSVLTETEKRVVGATLRAAAEAFFNGIARMAFAEGPVAGALVLAAVGLVAPWGAVGATLGGLAVALLGRPLFGQGEAEWRSGMAGYDAVLLGLLWGGTLARGGATAALFALALPACLAMRRPLERLFARLALPALGASALIVAWLSDLVFRAFDAVFWYNPGAPRFGAAGIATAVALVAAVWFRRAPLAAGLAALLGGGAALGAGWYAGGGFTVGPPGLWAFSVAPAVFAIPAWFLRGPWLGLQGGVLAGLFASLLWSVWEASPLIYALPPLMGPCFGGIWLALLYCLRADRSVAMSPSVQRAAALIREIRKAGGDVVALTGAGISTASGIPDYTSGAWLESGIPLGSYSLGSFIASASCRQAYWRACAKFRAVAQVSPNAGHNALAVLERKGWVAAVVTQNVDGLHQAAGSRRTIELHGAIDRVWCLACGEVTPWPSPEIWECGTVLCASCGGLVKPAVVAYDEDVPIEDWEAAVSAVRHCRALVVIGTQLAVSTAATLVSIARGTGARLIFLGLGPPALPLLPDDIPLWLPAERTLPALARLLGGEGAPSASARRASPRGG